MGTLAPNVLGNNGGWKDLGRRSVTHKYRGAIPPVTTQKIVVKSGQVLKARSWLQADTAGKMIAKAPVVEIGTVVFGAITSGQTVILGGLTWTAGGSGTTAAQLATAWAGITAGATHTSLAGRTGGGSFTAGTFTAQYNTIQTSVNTVVFYGITTGNLTDIASTGTGAASAVVTVVVASTAPVEGLLAMDVDATAGDVEAQMYLSGNFWTESILWGVVPTVDVVTSSAGVNVAVTAYETGARTDLLQQILIGLLAGGTNIQIGNFTEGEVEA
jgi:hypothetical protein